MKAGQPRGPDRRGPDEAFWASSPRRAREDADLHRRMAANPLAEAAGQPSPPPRIQTMLAFNVFGTKEIIVYVVVVVVLIAIGWYLMRGRSRA